MSVSTKTTSRLLEKTSYYLLYPSPNAAGSCHIMFSSPSDHDDQSLWFLTAVGLGIVGFKVCSDAIEFYQFCAAWSTIWSRNHRRNHGETHDDDDDEDNKVASVSRTVREWTRSVPIGMNLCPWAKLSDKEGRIRYVTCKEEVSNPQQASRVLSKEILRLVQNETKQQQQKEQQQHSPAAQGTPSPERKDGGAHEYRDGPRCKRPLPPWSTTLVICPYVEEWKNDFETFRAFVENFGSACTDPNAKVDATEKQKNNDHRNAGVTLVPFHPLFVRWRGLPEGIGTGSEVFCHKGLAGFGKSPGVFRATVLDPRPEAFGRRRVRVRFHDSDNNCGNANRNNIVDGKQQTATRRCTVEQYVPVDWVVPDEDTFNSSSNNVVGNGNDRRDVGHNSRDPPTKTSGEGLWHRPPLPDNAMHQAPYPVVHILRN
mmetsp:Transcript_23458/g.52166  ORF Transcript_23458/g.52166 Transcript_23458/m.52166 type:complete len:427 (+) Transcript_23458:201-1481(+)